MRNLLFLTILACLLVSGCTKKPNTDSVKLQKLFDDELEFSLREHPLFATYYGDHRFDDKLPQVTLADINRQFEQTKKFLQQLQSINKDALSETERVNYDIFERQLKDSTKWNQLQSYLMPISHMGGFYTHFAELGDNLYFGNAKDYENYIARLNAFDAYTQQHIELMRKGIAEGLTLTKIIAEQIPETIEKLIAEDVNNSALFKPFRNFPSTIGDADRRRLTDAGVSAIKQSVRPAYKKLLKFITDEYIPAARNEISARTLPNGEEYYKQCIKHHTTLDISPEQIHQTGLDEVKRIRQQIMEIVKRTGFDDDFNSFKKFVQTDAQFRPGNPKRLLKDIAYVLKKTDGLLPKYFDKLPRMPVGLREVPEYIAAESPIAYYSPPPFDKTRAGFYYVNTYDVNSVSLYRIVALTMHETNPGHHLQICLQQELGDMPAFRRTAHFTSYTEGWALYAEGLGEEMGMYEDDYALYGRYEMEMWRACRLVVDTGMHWFGWSRQQAIDYMAENTAISIDDIITEIDRYIVWPGQALSYKIGELKIVELRNLAEKQLGEKFDIRKFHEVVLNSGAVPLDILENNVKQWIAQASNIADK